MNAYQREQIDYMKTLDWMEEGRQYLPRPGARDSLEPNAYIYHLVNASGLQAHVYPTEVLYFPPPEQDHAPVKKPHSPRF